VFLFIPDDIPLFGHVDAMNA